MDIKKVTGVYFSPAGSTKTVVETTVDELARLPVHITQHAV